MSTKTTAKAKGNRTAQTSGLTKADKAAQDLLVALRGDALRASALGKRGPHVFTTAYAQAQTLTSVYGDIADAYRVACTKGDGCVRKAGDVKYFADRVSAVTRDLAPLSAHDMTAKSDSASGKVLHIPPTSDVPDGPDTDPATTMAQTLVAWLTPIVKAAGADAPVACATVMVARATLLDNKTSADQATGLLTTALQACGMQADAVKAGLADARKLWAK